MTQFAQAAVIGHPISHSKSPAIHRYWLRQHQIAGDYIRLDVPPEALAETLRHLPRIGFRGANVTLPHKEAALAIADRATARAQQIGAANTLFFQEGEILADNTDGYGFLANLQSGAPDWRAEGGPALVLGAGGAARAVLHALLDAGVPRIILTNRTRARAESLAEQFGPRISVCDWGALAPALSEAQLLVNTTSLGMTGQPALALDLDPLPSSCTVTDLVYAPLQTDLLARACAKGCPVVDGLGMLLHQAVPGFEGWFGLRPEVDAALRMEVLR